MTVSIALVKGQHGLQSYPRGEHIAFPQNDFAPQYHPNGEPMFNYFPTAATSPAGRLPQSPNIQPSVQTTSNHNVQQPQQPPSQIPQHQQSNRPNQLRPTAIATASNRDPNAPDSFEYVRDFSWELFRVRIHAFTHSRMQ